MKHVLSFTIAAIVVILFLSMKSNLAFIIPGEQWNDTDGNPINAHSAGILFDKGTYYWFGEYKKGNTFVVDHVKNWECHRVDAGGVSCYSSKNLTDWKFEGLALPSVKDDSTSEIHFSKVIERPKVIYNEKTKKYVMWFHVDSDDYKLARAAVATSDKPAGPYTYVGSMRPNGQMSRDMTLFKDDDGKAYHICSSEDNATLYISLLSDDYLQPSGKYIRVFEKQYREAPAVVKHNNKYFMITSGCTGWAPNEAKYAIAETMLGEWKMMGNPCIGNDADKTFLSQSTFILPIQGKSNEYIFMADRWNKSNLEDSRYVWLPMKFDGDKIIIEWKDKWEITLK